MNRHRVTVLTVVTAAALGLALWAGTTRRPEQPPTMAPVVPGLEAGINQVTEVRIRTAGDAVQATMRRGDDGWRVLEREGWPADVDALRQYLLKLARARRIEAKTSTPVLYEKLGVEPVDLATASGAQIEIDGLSQPVRLIVGRNVVRGNGSYVRHAGEAQSWQSDADLAVEKNVANWLQRDLFDVAAGRVQKVEVTPSGGAKIEIVRAAGEGGGDFAIANLPRGREAASEYVADATAGFLAALRLEDVVPGEAPALPASGASRARFETEEGIAIEVTAWKDGERTLARFSAALDEAVAAAFVEAAQRKAVSEFEAARADAAAGADEREDEGGNEDEGKGEASDAAEPAPLAVTDAARDREQRLAALRSEVEAMAARTRDKTFVLPAFKAGQLHKALEDYLKPKA